MNSNFSQIKIHVGVRIKQLRMESGLTQEKLANEIGLDRTYISGIERGRRNISLINLEKIWKYFCKNPKVFLILKFFMNNSMLPNKKLITIDNNISRILCTALDIT